jgi:hypothetical protein
MLDNMKRSMFALMVGTLALSACVKEEVVPTPRGVSGASGVGPTLVIDQFMRALNSEPKDLATMGRLFGTKEGPISGRDPKAQVEQRMFALASVLHHDDYEVVREQQVPGRTGEATQLLVRITAGKNTNTVPFTMVRYKDGAWLIEQIGIDQITNRR